MLTLMHTPVHMLALVSVILLMLILARVYAPAMLRPSCGRFRPCLLDAAHHSVEGSSVVHLEVRGDESSVQPSAFLPCMNDSSMAMECLNIPAGRRNTTGAEAAPSTPNACSITDTTAARGVTRASSIIQ